MMTVRKAIVWGALWGLALGFWLLAPLIVSTHHLTVTTGLEAAAVVLILGVLFVSVGAFLCVGISLLVATVCRVRRKALDADAWLLVVATGALLVPAYVALGCAIYAVRFGRAGALQWSIDAFVTALPAIAGSALAVGALHFATRRSRSGRRIRTAVGFAMIAAAAGIIALILKLPDVAGPPVQARRLAEKPTGGARPRLLVVGIDGGTWRTIEPLMRQGRLPTLQAIRDSGMIGDLEAQWPPYWSTASWSAIITGLPREEVGVYGDIIVQAPGLPAFQAPLDLDPRLVVVSAIEYALARRHFLKPSPPNRTSLRRPPIWETLEVSGRKAGLIRFNFSHPPRGQASVVISNRVVDDIWDLLGVKSADPREVVWPPARRAELLNAFSSDWTPPREELVRILGGDESIVPDGGPVKSLPLLKRVLSYDQRTVRAAAQIVKSDPQLDVLMIHFGGLDNVQHVFWPFRFPDDFVRRPPESRIAALGPVIDRYIEFLDRGIGEILAAYSDRPNVLVISDHGMGSFENRPPFKAWHASPGIFLAAGPDIHNSTQRATVTYYDIVPTMLELERLEKPRELSGRSIVGELAPR